MMQTFLGAGWAGAFGSLKQTDGATCCDDTPGEERPREARLGGGLRRGVGFAAVAPMFAAASVVLVGIVAPQGPPTGHRRAPSSARFSARPQVLHPDHHINRWSADLSRSSHPNVA